MSDSPQPASPVSYFCAVGSKVEGPFDRIELAAHLRYGTISPATLIQRRGEETWTPLQDLPEYPALHEISVEAIARHIEEKEREKPAPLSSARIGSALSGLKSVAIMVAIAIVLVLLLVRFQGGAAKAQPSGDDAAQPAAWVRTAGDVFSIECPVALDRQDAQDKMITECYRAYSPGLAVGVVIMHVPPELPEAMYNRLIDGLRDREIKGTSRTIVSQHYISVNGYPGLDVLFNDTVKGAPCEGGLRVLAGSGRLGVASYENATAQIHPGDVSRFLNSFLMH